MIITEWILMVEKIFEYCLLIVKRNIEEIFPYFGIVLMGTIVQKPVHKSCKLI